MLNKQRKSLVYIVLLLLTLIFLTWKARNLYALDTYTHMWQASEFWLGYEYDSSRLAFDDDLYLGDANGLWQWDNDSITIYNPQIGSVNYADWTLKAVGPCNITVTEFYTDGKKFRATVAGSSGVMSTLEFDNKISTPKRMVIDGSTYYPVSSSEWDGATAYSCWYYDASTIYVKILHSSTSTMTIWWTDPSGSSGPGTPPPDDDGEIHHVLTVHIIKNEVQMPNVKVTILDQIKFTDETGTVMFSLPADRNYTVTVEHMYQFWKQSVYLDDNKYVTIDLAVEPPPPPPLDPIGWTPTEDDLPLIIIAVVGVAAILIVYNWKKKH